MFTGLFAQEELGVGTPFWESIPTSIQEIVGITVIMGVGWTWFVRPRMVALVAEAVAQVNQEFSKALAATRDEIRGDCTSRRDSTRNELRGEIATTRRDLSEEIAATRGEIATTRDELRGEIADTRRDLSEEIAATRRDLSEEIAATRRDLSEEIAATRDELGNEIAGNRGRIGSNRDSIVAVREMISASRIETRDLLTDMRRENQEAHAAIGDRITQESKTLRTKIEGLSTDTARLAGAVDVLTSIWREGNVRGEIRTQ